MNLTINETLLSARKAYRFLFEYQSKILKLVSYIGSKYGIDYSGGYPHFSNMIKRNTSAYLDCWAWDWLNMYFYEFNFYNQNDKLNFSIFHMPDSGYFDSTEDPKYYDEKKLQVNEFKSIEESESKLIFVIGKNFWVEDCTEWGGEWNYKAFNTLPFGKLSNDNGGVLVFKQYPLVNFSDEGSILACMQDFQKFSHHNGISLEIQEKFFKK